VGDAVVPEAFGDAVVAVVRALRPGEVVTYGEVAAEAGRPGAARAVGRLLAASGGTLPWWRVVTVAGRLVPGHETEHARRLEAEGVVVVAGRVRRGPGGPSAPSALAASSPLR
jgi:methylated-DNA-protein-cysteine methyltransferase-like protein